MLGEDNDSTINIICENRITIQCNNATNMIIEGLTFTFNSNRQRYRVLALNVFNTDITISNSTFLGSGDNIEQAIHSNHGNIIVMNCVFEKNRGENGGAISIKDKSILILIGSIPSSHI